MKSGATGDAPAEAPPALPASRPPGTASGAEGERRLAITGVVTDTLGGEAHVALSSRELTRRQRQQLQRPAKKPRVGFSVVVMDRIL